MRKSIQIGRYSALLALALGACEVLIMISPFAGFFYGSIHFEPFLGTLSNNPLTAWIDGFFLNHSVVTTSWLLEWHRKIGRWLFALGIWGFLISAGQVYGKKILRRGVATGLLYRISRHPQYLCLGIAGWGLLTIWPRFLLLGFWVTMLFLYAGLARVEEMRMEDRYGESYRSYSRTRGSFLPGSPLQRFFAGTFGRLRPRALGWLGSYASCLLLAFVFAGLLRSYTQRHTLIVERPQEKAVVISAWPQPRDWVTRVFEVTLADEQIQGRLQDWREDPVVVTILPPLYIMKGMYYKLPPEKDDASQEGESPSTLRRIGELSARLDGLLFPVEGATRPDHFMGVDPDNSHDPVQVVISRANKPFKEVLPFDEILDASVRLTPLVVADVQPREAEVVEVRIPLPQNRWGSQVVMPVF